MDEHWSLVVVELDIEVIIVLDSYNELEDSTERHAQLINALKGHLYSSLVLQSANYNIITLETRVFFDVRFLQRLVADGRWQEARGYVKRFLPSRDDQMLVDAHTALRFITHLNDLDDLAQGKLGGDDAAEDLERQIEAIPSTMADPHYTEAASASAATLPNQPTLHHPLRERGHQRHQKNIGQTSAFCLARHFLRKKRRPPPKTQGSSSEPMDLEELIGKNRPCLQPSRFFKFMHKPVFEMYYLDETLLAGKQEAREHSDSCSEGIPGSPVFIGKSCGISPADAVKKCLSQEEYYPESAVVAKLPHATGKFCSDAVNMRSDHKFTICLWRNYWSKRSCYTNCG
ncbi:uncharacterized protein LOC120640336 [Panicum virgatum]|uniref:uncharacterized protein LOC120640336 n=1 Tax=Panicum virgatum TaxID=38727 RepID=UPI0019D612A0|nr:uncharacterized protein LOC120640336 [Panicum virgatum]